MDFNNLVEQLNDEKTENRLSALEDIKKMFDSGKAEKPAATSNVNNHIHTTYSFSPYSPTFAVYTSCMNGLSTCGIMDHDSMGGAKEFIEAGKIIGMPTTVGIEARVNVENTKLNGRKVNNPDQNSIAYVTLHGVPHQNIDLVNNYFAPFRKLRNKRNIAICENINQVMKLHGIALDFEADVLPLSKYSESGSVTERHIMFALAKKINAKYPAPSDVIDFFISKMNIKISDKIKNFLLEKDPRFYFYDILGILKSDLIEKVYVDAKDECPEIWDYIKISKASGAIAAYPYIGDIGESVTGDKKAQKFEDDYLDLLFDEITRIGFNAVTYMPTRNTETQLLRIIEMCKKYNFFQISGEDINSPRQSFICKALENPIFHHLIDSTWALIGHEKMAAVNEDDSMFSEKTIRKYPDINDRINYFKLCAQ